MWCILHINNRKKLTKTTTSDLKPCILTLPTYTRAFIYMYWTCEHLGTRAPDKVVYKAPLSLWSQLSRRRRPTSRPHNPARRSPGGSRLLSGLISRVYLFRASASLPRALSGFLGQYLGPFNKGICDVMWFRAGSDYFLYYFFPILFPFCVCGGGEGLGWGGAVNFRHIFGPDLCLP